MPLVTFWRGQVRPGNRWMMVLGVGLFLWLASIAVYLATDNLNQVPTITQLGSYLVPVTYMVWVYENGRHDEITFPLLFKAFIAGGVLGTLASSLLETYLIDTTSWWLYTGVGFIEEGSKIGALMLIARNLRHRSPRDGLILGGAVGFGFAGFESSGYALSAFLGDGDPDARFNIGAMVETEILRGLLSPLGHGLWTAILGGLLFSAARKSRWKLHREFWLAFVGVSFLHAFWNSMPGIGGGLALLITKGTGSLGTILSYKDSHPIIGTQTVLATAISWTGLMIVALLGTAWYRRLLSRFRLLDKPEARTASWHWRGREVRQNT